MCGVAYGWKDKSWADKTVELARENIFHLKEGDMETILEFVLEWERRLIE